MAKTNTRTAIMEGLVHEHIPYEVDMLFATYRKLLAGEPDVIFHNALIESFAIHARALIDGGSRHRLPAATALSLRCCGSAS